MATIKKLIKSAPRMRGVTPVPNGPLVKKTGEFKGSTLKKGGMLKRKDGSFSQRGLWDNIRANRGSGKKPTPEMLRQERKIKKMRTGGSTPAWQRKEGKNPSGGLNAKGVASYRRQHPGSKLKTAVTTKPSKLKPGSKTANRRKSFCARSAGQMAKFPKAAKDPNSRLRLARKKWNC
jgi:hypothetical protein